MFGSQQMPIPPSCLITFHAKLTEDTEEDLRYAVSLKGIDSDVSKIFINRSLETSGISLLVCTVREKITF